MDAKYWFFDLDGTLVRTGEDIVAAWKKSIADVGRVCPRFDEIFRIGPTLEEMAYALFEDATPELAAELTRRFGPNYDASGFPQTEQYPGIPEWLADLKAKGAKIFIATNKRHVPTQLIAKKFGWDKLFDGIWSHDSFAGQKYKKAELLAKLMRDMGIAAKDCVMVGDTRGDIEAGKANGMRTIGVTWGYGSEDEIGGADEIRREAR